MNKDDEELLLGAYLDGELSPGETIEMERRFEADPALRQRFERMAALSGGVKGVLAETTVPPGFAARMAAEFGESRPSQRPRKDTRWLAMAASLLIGLVGGGAIGYGLSDPAWMRHGGDPISEAVYAGHLRALAAPQPFDIASSDRHVVKPWFNGRTAIAPDAPDFGPEGYPLAGGRVDVVDGERVPTLVYRRRQHVISVTVVPKWKAANAAPTRREGSTIENWNAGDLTYFVVSDLNATELRAFADLFRSRTAPRG